MRLPLFVLVALVVMVGLLLGMLGGCAAAPRAEAAAPAADPRGLPMFGGDGERVSWQEVVSACGDADVVIVGENHGHPVGLPFAAELWKDVLAANPRAALSLEFFERDEQSRLDEYLLGIVDEATFRRRTGRTASNYPAAHREMVEAAKAAERPVIAANAPRPLVRLARTEGYERLARLSAEQRRMFRVPDRLPENRYRDDFFKLMMREGEGHESGGEGAGGVAAAVEAAGADDAAAKERARVESMFRSQSLWDWTMAESIARGLEEGNRPVLHVVGRFHSDFDGGLVQALRELKPGARVVVVSVVDAAAREMREEDRGRGDFVVYAGPAPPAPRGPRAGAPAARAR